MGEIVGRTCITVHIENVSDRVNASRGRCVNMPSPADSNCSMRHILAKGEHCALFVLPRDFNTDIC